MLVSLNALRRTVVLASVSHKSTIKGDLWGKSMSLIFQQLRFTTLEDMLNIKLFFFNRSCLFSPASSLFTSVFLRVSGYGTRGAAHLHLQVPFGHLLRVERPYSSSSAQSCGTICRVISGPSPATFSSVPYQKRIMAPFTIFKCFLTSAFL